MNKEQIVYKKLSELYLNDRNPRINDNAVDVVAKSIEKYGFKNPLIVDTNGKIWCGNTRFKASKKLGLKEVPCIIADDLTEEQIREYALLDNKTNELAEWDYDLLGEELCELDLSDFDLDWGIEEPQEEKQVEEDDFDIDANIPEEPKAKLGDIYQLGNHRLMCGDSFDKNYLDKLLDNNELDMVMTDPPYDMQMGGQGCFAESMQHCKKRLDDIINFDPYKLSFLPETSAKSFYIFTSKNGIPKYLEIFKDMNFNILVWCKTNCPPFTSGTFLPDIEYLLFFSKQGNKIWNNSLKPTEVYKKYYVTKAKEGTEQAGTDDHPTIKPLQILCDKIRISSNKNGYVLDLFGGSGSTLIACEQTDRCCLMMEYEPKYVDLIIARWEQFTGKKAEKLN